MKNKNNQYRLKRYFYYSLTILISIFTFNNIHSQNLEKKEFKKANTIRLYVNDSTKQGALERFVDYINKTGFQASIIKPRKKKLNKNFKNGDSFQLNQLNNEPELLLNSSITGDTIITNLATLVDVMMGEYTARLKFYATKDNTDKLYIAITGYVSSNAFGIYFVDLKMQKGGKDSNWAQRDLFKGLNKYLLNYTNLDYITYSAE